MIPTIGAPLGAGSTLHENALGFDDMPEQPRIELSIGDPNSIDPDVTIGYPPVRAVADTNVRIGSGAVIRSGSVIYAGVDIGERFQAGHHVVVREENTLGDDVSIWTNSVIDYQCVIGHRVKIHTNVYVAQNSVLEDDVFLAPGVSFANDKYPYSDILEGPVVKSGAKIGVNVTVLPGVTIGHNAMIGAGSVVTKDVADNMVLSGNPAVVVSDTHEIEKKRARYLAEKRKAQ